MKRGRKLAVKACIEVTLELLTKSLSDKIRTLVLCTGIGISLQTALLNILWNISEIETEDTVDALWAYGLVQFTDTVNNVNQHCVEVHAVISQYIIEHMNSEDLDTLGGGYQTGFHIGYSVSTLTLSTFRKSYGVHDPTTLTAMDYLKYKQAEIANVDLPIFLNHINLSIVREPHEVILILHTINDALMSSPYTIKLLSLIVDKISSLIEDSKQILKNAHIFCRKLKKSAEISAYEKNLDKLMPTIEEFINNYPLYNITLNAVTMVKKIMSYYHSELLQYSCERLQSMTSDYHDISAVLLPKIKLHIKLHKQITNSLLNGSPDIELTYHYIISGKFTEENDLVRNIQLIKLQEIAPSYVCKLVSQKQQNHAH